MHLLTKFLQESATASQLKYLLEFIPKIFPIWFQNFSPNSSQRCFGNVFKILSGMSLIGFPRQLSNSFSQDFQEAPAEVLLEIQRFNCNWTSEIVSALQSCPTFRYRVRCPLQGNCSIHVLFSVVTIFLFYYWLFFVLGTVAEQLLPKTKNNQ